MHRAAVAYGAALLVAIAIGVHPDPASAICDVIPGVTAEFRGALGSLNRPFAIPNDVGQQLTITLKPSGCDGASPGFLDLPGGAVPEDDYFVTVLFEPPGGGPRNAVVLTTEASEATCTRRVASARGRLAGGQAFCLRAEPGTQLFDIRGATSLTFRFPDTDDRVGEFDDDRTLTGPATIAVTPVSSPLPFALATARCAETAGLVACIDELYAADGTCGTTPREVGSVFGHFTALPPANDYEAICTFDPENPNECDSQARDLRFTVDARGNVLIAIDYRGVLLRPNGIPVPRLLRGSTGIEAFTGSGRAVRLPGDSFLASYSPGGHKLPPIFEPLADPTRPEALTLFGSADAPVGVIRLARRMPDLTGIDPVYRQCRGGGNDGLPCVLPGECPGGTCGAATCREASGTDTGVACVNDLDCRSGEECGPALFDFADRLESGVGPVLVASTSYELQAENPVPLEGLLETEAMFSFVELEQVAGSSEDGSGLAPKDLNGDGDTTDAVLVLRDRETGEIQSIGEAGSSGRAVTRVRQPPFSFPAVAAEGDVVAFLEGEPLQFYRDANGDSDIFDAILRVFKLDPSCGGSPCTAHELTATYDLALDAAPLIDGHPVQISDGLVFVRRSEAMGAGVATRPLMSAGRDAIFPDRMSADGRWILPLFHEDFLGVYDRDPDANGIFDEDGLLSHSQLKNGDRPFLTVFCERSNLLCASFDGNDFAIGAAAPFPFPLWRNTTQAMSPTGRFLFGELSFSGLFCGPFVLDRDSDGNGVFDDVGAEPKLLGQLQSQFTPEDGNLKAGPPPQHLCSRKTREIWSSDDGRIVLIATLAQISRSFFCFGKQCDTDTSSDLYLWNRDVSRDGVFDDIFDTRIELVTKDSDGSLGDVSADGRFILAGNAFMETANLLLRPPFLSADGRASLSEDGRRSAFVSAQPLVAGDTNGVHDVFVLDRDADEDGEFDEVGGSSLIRANLASDGAQSSFPSIPSIVRMTNEGRYVSWVTTANDLVPEDTNAGTAVNSGEDIYLHDTLTGFTKRISVGPTGEEFEDGMFAPADSSRDGLWHTFLAVGGIPGGGTCGILPNCRGWIHGPDPTDPLQQDLIADGDLTDVVLQVLDTRSFSTGPMTVGPADQVAVAAGSAVFLLPERALGVRAVDRDRNGDGDSDDRVVHFYRNRDPDGAVNLGLAAEEVTLSMELIGALASESAQEGAPSRIGNGDDDFADLVAAVRPVGAPATAGWTNLGLAADSIQAAGSFLAFLVPEVGQGRDLNGDEDLDDRVMHLFDSELGFPAGLLDLGEPAEEFVLGEQLVAFRSSECAQGGTNTEGCPGGGTDLNSDGDAADEALQVFTLTSGRLLNTAQAVTPCRFEACDRSIPYRVSGDTVTFLTLESAQSGPGPQLAPGCQSTGVPGECDLNGDGDAADLLVQTFNAREAVDRAIASGDARLASIAGPSAHSVDTAFEFVTPLAGTSAGICSTTGDACATSEECSGGSCFVPPGGCIEQLGTSCTSTAQGAIGCNEEEFCRPNPGETGTCHRRLRDCQSQAQCTEPNARCEDAAQDIVRLLGPMAAGPDGKQILVSGAVRSRRPASGGPTCDPGEACASRCRTDGECNQGEVCTEAGTCEEDRRDLVTIGAPDTDGDGVADPFDNCPERANAGQGDVNGNGIGDLCDRSLVDVRPGDPQNVVAPNAGGVVPVALLGSATFDIRTVDATQLAFGPSGAPAERNPPVKLRDANRDGVIDLVASFRVRAAGIKRGDTEACLSGRTLAGLSFESCDRVRTPPRPFR